MKKIVLSLIIGATSMASTAFATQIIAHRGASYDAPENTLSAFKLGYAQKADACELDIYLTRDGNIVVIHDDSTKRTGGVSKKIVQQSLDELRQQDVGQWGQWKGKGFSEKIPRLDEVLPLIPEDHRLFIEIKCGIEVLPELENNFERAGTAPAQTAIIGFGYDTMKAAKEKFTNSEVCWLVSSNPITKKFPTIDDLIKKAKDAHLDGLDLNYGFPIDKAFVEKVHKAGLKLYTWTVDDPEVARREAEAGVDGITTNRPLWMREQLAANP